MPNSLLASVAVGVSRGLVVDLGNDQTSVVPVRSHGIAAVVDLIVTLGF